MSRLSDGADLRAKVMVPRLNNAETGTSNLVNVTWSNIGAKHSEVHVHRWRSLGQLVTKWSVY